MMQGSRIFTIATAMVVFLAVAFTPLVPLMLEYYGETNIYIAKTIVGLLTLGAGFAFASALLNKEPKPKEGRLNIKVVPIVAGAAIVAIAWYTDLPQWIADWTGTTSIIGEAYNDLISAGVRIWTSVLTLIGVFIIKLGIRRKKEVYVKEPKKGERSQLLDNIQMMGREY